MLKESNLATKAKPAECSCARISNKIITKLACTGPGFASTKTAPAEHFCEKKPKSLQKVLRKKTLTHRFL